ncbi:uncharacterized protein LOC126844094 [Adelges cooleyi]|uniref:uncharacterized protein LOC126844094 n=1 Tax=Adelges cooleyi TaxID=133065 RepID=UPI0021806ED0|nr:uncharacterized protein LOC126844094 [Adelges cooleyi]
MNMKYILVLCFTIKFLVQTVAYSTDDVAIENYVVSINQYSGQETALTTAQLLNILGDNYVNCVNICVATNRIKKNDLNYVNNVLFRIIVGCICGIENNTVQEFLRKPIAIANFIIHFNQHSGRETALTTAQLLNILGENYVNYVKNYLREKSMTTNDLNHVNIALFRNIVQYICGKKNTTIPEFLNKLIIK